MMFDLILPKLVMVIHFKNHVLRSIGTFELGKHLQNTYCHMLKTNFMIVCVNFLPS